MGTTFNVAALEGNHLTELRQVGVIWRYPVVASECRTDTWEEWCMWIDAPMHSQNEQRIAACFNHGWTIILNEELCDDLSNDDQLGHDLSAALNCRVFFGCSIESTGTDAFRLYDGEDLRSVLIDEGEVDKRGKKLRGEPKYDPESEDSDYLQAVMDLLGIEIFDSLESSPPYVMLTVSRPEPVAPSQRKRKPWWQFW